MENYIRVANKIDNEGFDYFILSYTDASSMPDKKGAELFEKARIALEEFKEYVDMRAEAEDSEEDD